MQLQLDNLDPVYEAESKVPERSAAVAETLMFVRLAVKGDNIPCPVPQIGRR